MQEQWDIMKRSNLWIKGIDEGEESQTNGVDQIFNMILGEKTTLN